MPNRGTRTKREITKAELDQFLKDNPDLEFDGLRYFRRETMRGGHWNKTVASVEGDKFYLIED